MIASVRTERFQNQSNYHEILSNHKPGNALHRASFPGFSHLFCIVDDCNHLIPKLTVMNKFVKISVSILFLTAWFAAISVAQSDRDIYRTEIFFTSDSPVVDIRTSGGYINVTGTSSNEVEVKMIVKRGRNFLTPSDEDLSDYEITIIRDGDRIVAEATSDRSGWSGLFGSSRNISISFDVSVPEGATVDGRTSGGSISVANLHNQVNMRTSGGSVKAENVSGNTDLRTSGGSITLAGVAGVMNARTSGGSIRVSDLMGEAELRTSGGSIRLENIAAKLTARTSGGNIRAHLVEFSDDVSLRTSGGSIRIDMPYTQNYDLELRGGRVDTELHNFTGQAERNRINGKIGEGGPLLSARTSGSSVQINYQ